MKRLFILLSIMGLATYLMLTENDKKKMKKKLKKEWDDDSLPF